LVAHQGCCSQVVESLDRVENRKVLACLYFARRPLDCARQG
jgi:hypothetical protein